MSLDPISDRLSMNRDSMNRYEQEVAVHHSVLVAYIRNCSRDNPDIAEDIVQNTMIRALEKWEAFVDYSNGSHREAQVKAWLFKIAYNQLLDYFAVQKRERDFNEQALQMEPVSPKKLLEEQVCDEVIYALADTDEKFRDAMLRAVIEEQTYAEIACELQIPIGTVKSRISRGFSSMRKSLHGTR